MASVQLATSLRNESIESFRRRTCDIRPHILDLRHIGRIVDDPLRLGIQPVDDRLRRSGRHEQAGPCADIEFAADRIPQRLEDPER